MSSIKRPSEIAGSSERSHQVALFQFLNVAAMHGYEIAWDFESGAELPKFAGEFRHPELKWLHAIPNGASFGAADDKAGRAFRGMLMKTEGLKPGVPDLFFPFPAGIFSGLYVEMKKPSGGVLSAQQKDFLAYAEKVGYCCVVCKTWREAAEAVEKYHVGH